jgi:CheY-like chemotaxis protein
MDPHQAQQAGRLVQAVDSVQALLRPLQTVLNPPAPRKALVQLNDLVQEAAALVEQKAQRMGITVEVTLEPDLPGTGLDAALISQALTNLFLSALQAMALCPTKRLRIATRRSGETLQVVVQDTAPAIQEAKRAELFDPASAASTEALSLPVAEIIARQHGGRLSVRSQEGLGNAFLLELPLTTVEVSPSREPKGLTGAQALVVDDEPFLLECLVDALGSWGLKVDSCSRGDEAIQKLEASAFDLIVSDIRMPGLTGMELYDWLKVQRPAMTQRILYTTGDSFDAKTRGFLESSQVPYLGKPFDLKQLKQSLERLLETSVEA